MIQGIKAILSTTILPVDGVYDITTLSGTDREKVLQNLQGVQHYIGHPATKGIVEKLGAIPAESKLFAGLEAGETAIALSIRQGVSSRKDIGHTVHQEVSIEDLDVRIIKKARTCPFCNEGGYIGWHCTFCGAT